MCTTLQLESECREMDHVQRSRVFGTHLVATLAMLTLCLSATLEKAVKGHPSQGEEGLYPFYAYKIVLENHTNYLIDDLCATDKAGHNARSPVSSAQNQHPS